MTKILDMYIDPHDVSKEIVVGPKANIPSLAANEIDFAAKRNMQSVFQSNEMARSVKRLYSASGAKVLLYLVSKIKKEDQEFPIMVADIRELCVAAGWDPDCRQNRANMKALVSALADSSKSSFSLRSESGWEIPLPWLSTVFHKRGSNKIAIRLNQRLSPYYLNLTANFTRMDTVVTNNLKGKYSLLIYELAKEIQFKGADVVSLDRIRELCALDQESYQRFSNINQKILKPAIEEINENTDIRIIVTPLKDGRKVIAINIKIESTEKTVTEKMLDAWLAKIHEYRLPDVIADAELKSIERMLSPEGMASNQIASNSSFSSIRLECPESADGEDDDMEGIEGPWVVLPHNW